MVMLQIIDISDSFLYDQSKAKNEFLSLINATVSHEMRNPLNSISAENLHKKELLKQLKELMLNRSISLEVLRQKVLSLYE
jgi:signal transduction histidine kinase